MKTKEVATIYTSSSDHTHIIPSRDELYEEADFYKYEGRPQECFDYCRYQVNIGLDPSSYQYMQDNNLSEEDYIRKFGKDFHTFTLITNCATPYLRNMPESRGHSYPSGRSPYVDPNNDYAKGTDAFRDERCPKVAWGFAAVFVWDLLYEDDKEDFRLLCTDEQLMHSYYDMLLKEFLNSHNTRKYNHLTSEEKEQMFLDEYIAIEKKNWERSTPLKQFPTIYEYTRAFMDDYMKFLQSKRPALTAAQIKNDEKYIRLLMHNTNVYLIEQYFERGPQRIDTRVVLMRDIWYNIINSPDFIIYDKELSKAITGFFDPWNKIIVEGQTFYFTSNTPGDYVFGGGGAQFDMFRNSEESAFFDKLIFVWNELYQNFRAMIDFVKTRYVIDFEDIDDSLCKRINQLDLNTEAPQVDEKSIKNNNPLVYVSYPWVDMALMDEICDSLRRYNIKYSRDKEDCGFRCNIQNFEEQIADADIVIGIINANSLRSIDRMYELCGLVMNGHPDKRLIPVVDLPGAHRDPQTCNQYVVTWKSEMQSLITEMSTVEGDKQNYIDKLAYYNRIVTEFPKLWRYITKHNTLSIPELRNNDWQLLRDEIKSINPKI